MKKSGHTRDELIRNFNQAGSPEGNDFPSASSGPRQTTAPFIAENNSVEVAPVAGLSGEKEYRAPASNLPLTVSAAESLRHNCSQGLTPWNAESAAEEVQLAGTRPATKATAPIAPTVMQDESHERRFDPEGNAVEDAFATLRRRGGGW